MRKIALTQGRFAIIDDEDFNELNRYKWQVTRNGYAIRTQNKSKKKGILKKTGIYMHKVIMGNPMGFEVDHINGNPADNRKSNLRIIKHKQNSYNLNIYKNNRMGYKGVHLHKQRINTSTPFTATIRVNKKLIHLGCFKSLKDAALAYNNASKQYHGEFGRLNNLV